MRSFTTTYITPALFAAALSLPLAAWAQTTTTPAPNTPTSKTTPPEAIAPAAKPSEQAQQGQTQQQKVEQRIADMHATLHITQGQEHEWDQFANVMLANAQAMDTLLSNNAGKEASQNAQEILQTYAQITQLHANNVQKLSMAFNTLYTSLTPEQKKAADEMFREGAERHEQKRMQKQNG